MTARRTVQDAGHRTTIFLQDLTAYERERAGDRNDRKNKFDEHTSSIALNNLNSLAIILGDPNRSRTRGTLLRKQMALDFKYDE